MISLIRRVLTKKFKQNSKYCNEAIEIFIRHGEIRELEKEVLNPSGILCKNDSIDMGECSCGKFINGELKNNK